MCLCVCLCGRMHTLPHRVDGRRVYVFLLRLPSDPRSWPVDKMKEPSSWPPSGLSLKVVTPGCSQVLGPTLAVPDLPLLLQPLPCPSPERLSPGVVPLPSLQRSLHSG